MTKRWVILHGGALGDLVLTLQLALRVAGGRCSGPLHVVSRTNPGNLAECRPQIVRTPADSIAVHALYAEADTPVTEPLRNLLRGAWVLNALGDARSVPHARLAALEPAAVYSIDPRPRVGLQRHITQQWLTDLEAQGLLVPKCVHQRPGQRSLGLPDDVRAQGADRLARAGSGAGAIVIHPGSGGQAKCWSLENYVRVARALRAAGAGVCMLLGPTEVEWWSEPTIQSVAREFPALIMPSPDELVAALAAAGAVLANDSGPAHLSGLLGTRTIVIFGPTSPVVWRPLGAAVHIVTGDAECENWGLSVDAVLRQAFAWARFAGTFAPGLAPPSAGPGRS